MTERQRERERQRQTERQAGKQRERDRQTDRQRQTERQRDRERRREASCVYEDASVGSVALMFIAVAPKCQQMPRATDAFRCRHSG